MPLQHKQPTKIGQTVQPWRRQRVIYMAVLGRALLSGTSIVDRSIAEYHLTYLVDLKWRFGSPQTDCLHAHIRRVHVCCAQAMLNIAQVRLT